ncbi:acyl carrier protein [Hyphomicrobium sp.]|jgi:acyl carrier protein|uniref:acyl carrier protein n=1 Tax=Hyphomicrobium sp. TaxID=82 RepID=UPI003566BCEC
MAEVIAVLLDAVKVLAPAKALDLDKASAQRTTLRSLELDSLDTLQLAMNIEDALGVDIEIVDFPDTLTLAELAERLSRQIARAKNSKISMSA